MNERKMTINKVKQLVENVLSENECDATVAVLNRTATAIDEPEEGAIPSIPADVRHKEEFYDSEDIVIPGTEVKRSRTEENEQVVAWIKETGRYPIVYLRLDDGVHVEVSDIYDRKVRDVLERGEAVGGDGRKYKFENPDNIFPIGDSICVRAYCIATGRVDVYGLDFFV